MSESFGFDVDVDDDEVFEETPEIEQPEFEEIFQGDITEMPLGRRREGADRISKPFLGKLAKGRLIAARAGQLQLGFPSVISKERLRSGEIQEIALQEFDEQVANPNEQIFPIKIVRRFADGSYEVWRVGDFKYFVRDSGRSQRSRQRKLREIPQ